MCIHYRKRGDFASLRLRAGRPSGRPGFDSRDEDHALAAGQLDRDMIKTENATLAVPARPDRTDRARRAELLIASLIAAGEGGKGDAMRGFVGAHNSVLSFLAEMIFWPCEQRGARE